MRRRRRRATGRRRVPWHASRYVHSCRAGRNNCRPASTLIQPPYSWLELNGNWSRTESATDCVAAADLAVQLRSSPATGRPPRGLGPTTWTLQSLDRRKGTHSGRARRIDGATCAADPGYLFSLRYDGRAAVKITERPTTVINYSHSHRIILRARAGGDLTPAYLISWADLASWVYYGTCHRVTRIRSALHANITLAEVSGGDFCKILGMEHISLVTDHVVYLLW